MPQPTDHPAAPPERDSGASIGRAVRTVSGLTLASRVLGLVRDLATVRIFGDSAVGSAFAAALAIPNMFRRLFGEGALSAAFLPEYARLQESDAPGAGAFARTTVALLAIGTGGVTVVIELFLLALLILAPGDADRTLSLRLIMVTLPFMPLVCVAAILGGMLQTHGRFAPWAAAPIILNLCIIAASAPYWVIEGASARAWGYIIGASAVGAGVLQVAWSLRMLRGRVDWRSGGAETSARVRAMLRRMIPALIGLGTLQLNSFIDTIIAMWPLWVGPRIGGVAYPLDEASNSVLYYAQRLYQFPLGVFGIAVATAVFPALSRASENPDAFARTLRRGIRLSLFIAIPASVGLALVRTDLVSTLYSGIGDGFSPEGVRRAGWVVLGYSVGVWAYSLNQLWTRAFYARNDTTTPMRIAIAMVALNLVLNLTLIWRLGEAGLAWSTSVAAIVQCALLGLAARRRLALAPLMDASVRAGVFRSVAISAVMGLRVWGVLGEWGTREGWTSGALALLCATLVGGVVYLGASWIARAPELFWLIRPEGEGPGAGNNPDPAGDGDAS
ncbi:MAG: murein biosynthesis integral membrane protein MurJ [Phycisphaerales bacterium JB059]